HGVLPRQHGQRLSRRSRRPRSLLTIMQAPPAILLRVAAESSDQDDAKSCGATRRLWDDAHHFLMARHSRSLPVPHWYRPPDQRWNQGVVMAPEPESAPTTSASVLVIFGITGDLAKVMTFRSLYRLEARGLLKCPVVGVAFDDWTVDQLVQRARESIEGAGERLDPVIFNRFAERLSYVSGDFTDPETYRDMGKAIGDAGHPVFYLEVPPSLFSTVVKGLAEAGLNTSARIVVEKPFGHDIESARQLDGEIHQYIDESQLYRID